MLISKIYVFFHIFVAFYLFLFTFPVFLQCYSTVHSLFGYKLCIELPSIITALNDYSNLSVGLPGMERDLGFGHFSSGIYS